MEGEHCQTRIIKIDPQNVDESLLVPPAEVLREGGVVAFPTETVYGLGASIFQPRAVRRVFAVKGRPADNPLIVHIAEKEWLEELTPSCPPAAWRAVEVFWPGPLTIVVPRSAQVPPLVTAGLDKVGIRMPSHPVALALIRLAGVPVAAPSANTSGRPSPTVAAHVAEDLAGKIDWIVDGGPCQVGIESTVVDFTTPRPLILRPGAITAEMLTEVTGVEVGMAPGLSSPAETPPSPGMKYVHYAPQGEMFLFEGPEEKVHAELAKRIEEALAGGKRVGLLLTAEMAARLQVPEEVVAMTLSSRKNPEEAGTRLYGCLREFDRLGVEIILAEGYPRVGRGIALMNRMEKAARRHIRLESDEE